MVAGGALQKLVDTYFQPTISNTVGVPTHGGVPESRDDAEVLRLMLKARPGVRATFGDGATPAQLWHADEDALASAYPPMQGGPGWDNSSADLALLNHLMYWSQGCPEQVERLFGESGLIRDKWREREDYRSRTIAKVYTSWWEKHGSKAQTMSPAQQPREGFQFQSISQQAEHFKGCVYILDQNRVLTPDGGLLDQARFRAIYGGYVFALDTSGKATTKSAWEAFTESQSLNLPWAHTGCFRPELGPGEIIKVGEYRAVNTYVAIKTPCEEGDVSRFTGHIAKLLPVPGDQDILLAYMASMVQNPGKKFYWTPLLQGCEGNGKSLIISVMAEIIGHVYTHLPLSSDLGSTHNGWVENKLFIGVEEVFTLDRMEIIEPLKRIITDSRIGIRKMQTDQFTGDNRANCIMCSNHQDAVRKSNTDRRFCILYTGQQKRGDITSCGMGGLYFPDLYTWLRSGGYAHIHHYLRHYDIPKALDPAGACHRAPESSSTEGAIRLSLGGIEQEILEAAEEGRQGFRGGWVSSIALSTMLRETHRKLSHAKRSGVLENLGYVKHPGLDGGRSPKTTALDGGRPRLHILATHPSLHISDPLEVVATYEKAQNTG